MKRMTSRQAPQSHPHPLRRAITLDGLAHIIRTGRIEAARRGEPGGNTKLIYAERPRYDPLQRRNRRSTSRCKSASGRIERFAAGIDDDGPLGAQPIELEADGLADTPLDAVAHHGFAEGAGGGEPDMRSIRLRFAHTEGREQGAGETGSVVIDASEIFRSQQAYTFGKTGDGTLPLGTDGQFFAASGPAARQHRAAILGFHTGEKAMRLGTMTIIRLKSTFRHLISSN